MTQIATTIEQGRKLLELGVPADTADMEYHLGSLRMKLPKGCVDDDSFKEPAWSLSALLALLYHPNTYFADGLCIVHASPCEEVYVVSHSGYGATYFEALVNILDDIILRGYNLNYSNNGEDKD
jgi:hypothetical protein